MDHECIYLACRSAEQRPFQQYRSEAVTEGGRSEGPLLALSGSANRARFRPELGVNLPYIDAIASSAHDSIPDVPREACLPSISLQQAIFRHVSVGLLINRA
jgi:hypothetical protein